MKPLLFFALVAVAAMGSLRAQELNFTVKQGGIVVLGTSVGKVVVAPPKLMMSSQDYTGQKPTAKIEGETLVANYECGAELRMEVVGNDVKCSMTGIPAEAKAFRFEVEIPISVNKGGKYSFDGKPLAEIPADQGEQFLQQGSAEQFTVIGTEGDGLTIKVPQSWQALQDNRKFNWAIYQYLYVYDFKKLGTKSFEFQFAPAKS